MVRFTLLSVVLAVGAQAELPKIPKINLPKTIEQISDHAKNTPFDPKTWEKTVRNTPFDPRTYPGAIRDAIDIPAHLCRAYLAVQREAAGGTHTRLSHTQKFYLRPWFGDLVDEVSVYYGAHLPPEISIPGIGVLAVKAEAQTIGKTIYIRSPNDHRADEVYHLLTLAHEMHHVWQYQQLGSPRKFCEQYANGVIQNQGGYYGTPLEHSTYEFEANFGGWLQANYPNRAYLPNSYATASPYVRRTIQIPALLLIPEVEYAVLNLFNPTSSNISYGLRYGNGGWTSFQVAANNSMIHDVALEGGSRKTQKYEISFDASFAEGHQPKVYSLDSSVARSSVKTTIGNGAPYTFVLDTPQTLDLKTGRPQAPVAPPQGAGLALDRVRPVPPQGAMETSGYRVVCILNSSGNPVTYQFAFGTEAPNASYTLKAGRQNLHSVLANNAGAGDFVVSVDLAQQVGGESRGVSFMGKAWYAGEASCQDAPAIVFERDGSGLDMKTPEQLIAQ